MTKKRSPSHGHSLDICVNRARNAAALVTLCNAADRDVCVHCCRLSAAVQDCIDQVQRFFVVEDDDD